MRILSQVNISSIKTRSDSLVDRICRLLNLAETALNDRKYSKARSQEIQQRRSKLVICLLLLHTQNSTGKQDEFSLKVINATHKDLFEESLVNNTYQSDKKYLEKLNMISFHRFDNGLLTLKYKTVRSLVKYEKDIIRSNKEIDELILTPILDQIGERASEATQSNNIWVVSQTDMSEN